jgi:tetratricopeptide (TPR) repeat protein
MRIEAEIANFIHALRFAEEGSKAKEAIGQDAKQYLKIIAGITVGLSRYFFVRGFLKDGARFIESGIVAMEKMEDFSSAASQYVMLGYMQARMHDYSEYERTTGKLVSLARRCDKPDISALASLNLGELAKHQGRIVDSINNFNDAATYFRQELSKNIDASIEEESREYLTGMLGMTLRSLGEIYELLHSPKEALEYHKEALAYVTSIADHTNIGSIYHHIGNCYGDMGNIPEAVSAYKKALNSFYQLGYRQYISNSLADMGNLVAAGGFDSELEEFLTEGLIEAGLDDIKFELRLLVRKSSRPVEADIRVLSKLFGVIKLTSFSTKAMMLKQWALEIEDEIIDPLSTNDVDDLDLQHESFRQLLHFIINVAHFVGDMNVRCERYSEEQVHKLCVNCHLIERWAVSKPFEWLAALLNYRDDVGIVTTQQLREIAISKVNRL